MLKHLLLSIVVIHFLFLGTAWGKPASVPRHEPYALVTEITFGASDATDSDLVPGGGTCSISATIEGSDVIEVYQVASEGATAASGDLVGTFSVTTVAPTTLHPAQAGFKAKATVSVAGGSVLRIRCSNTQLSAAQSQAALPGISGTRHMTTFIDENLTSGKAQPQEFIKWEASHGPLDNSEQHQLSDNTGMYNTRIMLAPIAGGRLRATALGIHLGVNNNSSATHQCVIEVHKTEIDGTQPALVTAVVGPATNWTACDGTLKVGPTGTNSGGIGDSTVNLENERYLVPLTSCECLTTTCRMVVSVQDRNTGASEECTFPNDWNMAIFLEELSP